MSRFNEDIPTGPALKYLAAKAEHATIFQLMELVTQYGHNADAFRAITDGVAAHGRREDSGSYCEKASQGYPEWVQKNQYLNELALTKKFKRAARRINNEAASDDIRIARIEKRLRRMERMLAKALRNPSP